MSLLALSAALFAGSFLLSGILTAAVRALAIKSDFVCHPVVDRYHQKPVPLGGGIAIFLTMLIFIIAVIAAVQACLVFGFPNDLLFAIEGIEASWLSDSFPIYAVNFFSKINQLSIILLSASALFLLGLCDDKKHLGPFVKLAVQIASAVLVAAFADVRVELFIESKIITTLISAFWIVLIINAFNFLDNMDGLSAGIAAIVSCILLTAAAVSGQVFVGGLAIVFAGTLLGFLVFNFPPAKIFMGDAGSLVVGFFVALLTLKTTYYHQARSGHWYSVLLPLMVMAVPLYDFISVTVLRIKQHKSPFLGDTQHFSHRLKKRGLTDTQTVLTLYMATLATGLGAIFFYQVSEIGAILILIQAFLVLTIIAVLETTGKNETNDG